VAPEMKVVVVEQEVKVKVTAAGDAVTDAAVVVEKGEEQMREQEEKDEATVTDLEKLEREKDEETETETERADDRKIEEKKSMGEGDSMLWKQASLALLTEISDALGEEEQGLEKWLSQCQMFASNRPNAL